MDPETRSMNRTDSSWISGASLSRVATWYEFSSQISVTSVLEMCREEVGRAGHGDHVVDPRVHQQHRLGDLGRGRGVTSAQSWVWECIALSGFRS